MMDLSHLPRSLLALVPGDAGRLALLLTAICLLAPPIYYLHRYRASIKARVKEIEKTVSLARVVRNKDANPKKNRVMCLELDPQFVKDHPEVKMMSFGEYLSQLQPAEPQGAFNRLFLQKELEITIGDFLLKHLGRTYGAALLPALGAASVAGSIAGLSSKISKFLARSILSDDATEEGEARGIDVHQLLNFDLSLMEVVSFVNLHQKTATPASGSDTITSLDYLGRGEKAAGDLSYDLGDGEFPHTFDLSDFDKYVKLMEERIREKNGTYDPNDRSFPPSAPINERLLPGLHIGKGDLQYTHTKREGLEHRLICVLLNKLCHNYYKLSCQGKLEDCFKVICNGKECLFPEELIQGLVDTGHTVQVCPRCILTNFGMQLCVKEDDGSFTYVPTAVMLRTGVEDTSDGRPAYFAAPHGGMDVNISGPLIGKGKRPAWLQFYLCIDGVTCFYPDEDQDAPWAAKTSLTNVYSHEEAIRAIRMCAVVSITFNRMATDLSLPFGGYGILGMCNDSSTLIDFAIHGKTNAYPLLSTGRYLNHTVAYLIQLREDLSENASCGSKLGPVIDDILCLIKSTSRLPSDLHISPATLIGTSRRYDASYSFSVFQSTTDAKAILRELSDTAREYLE